MQAGTLLDDRYELVRPLGGGGMGNVFLAIDRETGLQYALKILPENSRAQKSAIAREFEALRRIDHPGVVRVHSLHGRYYTMEHVEGKRLSQFIGGELTQSLDLVVDLCSTLAHIHSCGVIHRDLKPDNILVLDEKRIKVMDFGLALSRVRRGEPIGGTVQYMAPELLKGFEIDPRADLYSVGIILYQLVTRRLPFESADLMSTVMDHIRTPPPPPRSFNRQLPEEFERVILKAIAKNPMERYQTAEELLADLVLLGGRSEIQKMRIEKGAAILMKPAFIGREQETARLEAIQRQVREERALALTFVTAARGVGASRLLAEFAGAHLAPDDLIVEVDLQGQHGGPLGSLSSVVASTVLQLDSLQPETAKRLLERWGALLLAAAPTLAEESTRLAGAVPLEGSPAELREQLLDFFLAVAEELPLALFFHSFERCPKPLADFLLPLVARAVRLPCWLAGTLQRDAAGEIPRGPWELVANCELHERARTSIELTPLSDAELVVLLSSMIGNKPLDERLLGPVIGLCHGRPLLGVELFRGLAEDGQIYRRGSLWLVEIQDLTRIPLPALIEESLLEQAPGLSKAAHTLISIVALADGKLPVELCGELVGLKKKKLGAACDELEATGFLLRNAGRQGRLELPFGGVRKQLASQIPQPRKVQWHGLLAARMEKILDSQPADLRMIAEHYRRAGEFDKAIVFYTRAGEAAKKYLETEQAIENFDQARELAAQQDTPELLVGALGQLASLHSRKGSYDRAIQLYSQALKHRTTPADELFYRKGLAYAYFRQRKLEQAQKLFDSLVADAPQEADHYYYLGMIHLAGGEVETAESVLRKGVEIATRARADRDRAALYLQLGRLKFEQGLFHNALNFYRKAQELLEGDGHLHLKSRISISLALYQLYRGDAALAYKHLEDALYLAGACGDQSRAISARLLIGSCFERRSELQRAGSIYRECLEQAQRSELRPETAKALLAQGRLLVLLQDPQRAVPPLQHALKLFRELQYLWGMAHAYFHLGEALLLSGQHNQARSALAKAERYMKKAPMRWMLPRVYCRVVELMLREGESKHALKTLNKSLQKARDVHDKLSEGLVFHRYGLYCEQHDLPAEAREHFVAARTVLALQGSPLELGQLNLDYGRFLLAQEKQGELGYLKSAARHLAGARALFERAGVRPLAQQASLSLEECQRSRLSSGLEVDPRRALLAEQLDAVRDEARQAFERIKRAFAEELDETMDEQALLDRFEKRIKEAESGLFRKVGELKKKNEKLARQLGELQRERKNLLALQEINYQISSTLDSGVLLDLILDSALEAVKAERGFILLEGEKGETEVKAARGRDRQPIEQPQAALSRTVVQRVMQSGEPVLAADAQADGRFDSESIRELKLRSFICVPLQWKTKVIGALYVDNRTVSDQFTERDLDFLMTFSSQAALALENALLYEELQKKEQIEQELNIANRIQQKLLPKTQPRLAGLEVHGMMQPARMVGGDYYDFIERDGSLTVCIGDVSGKGVPAGLVMVMAQLFLHHWDIDPADTRETMLQANRILHANTEPFVFMSMLLLNWNPAGRVLRYTGAGHENLLVYRAGRRKVEVIPAGGVVLGIKADIAGVLDEKELELAPGDAVLLYTDGATEAQDSRGEMYQLARLRAALADCGQGTAEEIVAHVFAELQRFIGQTEQHDDITLAALKCTAD